MNVLIETPYGRKTPELLCKAMDAHTLLPELINALEAVVEANKGFMATHLQHLLADATSTITKAKELTS